MGNTRIVTQEFDYLTPQTLSQVLQLLNQYGRDAKIIAGGTDVVPQLKYEKIAPAYLINVARLSDLTYIREDKSLRIGAGTKLRDVKQYCENTEKYACLYDAMCSIGKVQVMNMGTLGGNLCTASPAADSAPPLLVLDGRAKLISEHSERTVSLGDFFRGPNMTAMEPDEMMLEIQIPAPKKNSGNAFIKIARVAADISKISCAVAVTRQGNICTECRIAMGAVAAVPLRIPAAESKLCGQSIADSVLDETAKVLSADIKPLTDVRSTESYRKHVARILFKDTFARAWNRAGGEE
jgi:carbon-monoxide dehydrogenase medium subunit